MVGIVGILEDVTKAVPADFQRVGDAVLLLRPGSLARVEANLNEFGSSEYAKKFLNALWGVPPALWLEAEAELHRCLAKLADEKLLHSARDISDGGIAVALAEATFARGIGVQAEVPAQGNNIVHRTTALFAEQAWQVLMTCAKDATEHIAEIAGQGLLHVFVLGTTIADRVEISVYGETMISESITKLQRPWQSGVRDALESTFHRESCAVTQA